MIKIHNTSYGPALRSALINANKSIYICTYVTVLNFKKKNDLINILFIILRQKLAANIDVKFIIDRPRRHKPNYHAIQFLIRRLKTWGFPFWVSPERMTCHAKVVLIDGIKLFTGSHNLAKSSFQNPLEFSLEISDLSTCEAARLWFEKMFGDPAFTFFPKGKYEISDIYP